jgi:hypothetical protein
MTTGPSSVPTPEAVPVGNDQEADRRTQDIVEEWGLQSFPASDAPANW